MVRDVAGALNIQPVQAFDLLAEDQPLIERIEVKVGATMGSLAEGVTT